MGWNEGQMNWNGKVRRALEIELQEIEIYADIAQRAPLHVADQMLRFIAGEALDATHWIAMLSVMPGPQETLPQQPNFGYPFAVEGEDG